MVSFGMKDDFVQNLGGHSPLGVGHTNTRIAFCRPGLSWYLIILLSSLDHWEACFSYLVPDGARQASMMSKQRVCFVLFCSAFVCLFYKGFADITCCNPMANLWERASRLCAMLLKTLRQ